MEKMRIIQKKGKIIKWMKKKLKTFKLSRSVHGVWTRRRQME